MKLCVMKNLFVNHIFSRRFRGLTQVFLATNARIKKDLCIRGKIKKVASFLKQPFMFYLNFDLSISILRSENLLQYACCSHSRCISYSAFLISYHFEYSINRFCSYIFIKVSGYRLSCKSVIF